ncbi:MAG: CBS domain-containing protein [Nitrospirae bacterium]|nr:CBS domain-containing protein [Nitrospirota bacterium]MDA1304000.1 CBS domain-containing protein [Nitrospirota bacterium]
MNPVKMFMIPAENFVTVDHRVNVQKAVEIMRDHEVGSVFISKEGDIMGNVSDTEVVWRLVATGTDPSQITVEDVMSTPIPMIDENQTLQDANDLMAKEQIRHLGISKNGKIVGMVSVRDVLVAMTSGPSSVLPPSWAYYQKGVKAYENGDYKTAMKQFGTLAEQGMARAQYHLGSMYQQGHGVAQNEIQALMWAFLAAMKGVDAAVSIQKALIKEMPVEQIIKAERLAWDWQPQEK